MSRDKCVRNNKLESFLKRNLHPAAYSAIRWYEAVILRTGNSLAYKHVVVTGEDVYVTDTPPRALHHLVHASSITNLALVHDLPEFLNGGERDQTTHIKIRVKPSRRTSIIKTKTRRRSIVEEPSTASIDEESDVAEGDSPDSPATHVLARAAHDTASICSDPLPSLSITSNGENLLFPSSPRPMPLLRRKDATALAANHLSLSPRNGAKTMRSLSPDLERLYHDRSLTPTIAELLEGGGGLMRSSTPDSLSRSRMPRSLSALETYHRNSPLSLDMPTRSKSVLDRPSAPGQTPRRTQSLNLSDMTDGLEKDEEFHLYTLSTSTLLFHLLHSLWVVSLLKQTQGSSRIRNGLQDASAEHTLDNVYGQLRAELLTAEVLEERFSVLQELQQGATKYSSIRRLVWRDPDMIKTLRRYVKQYAKMNASDHKTEDPEETLQKRQDELEMLALTLETLATYTQSTQRCPYKMKVLKHNNYELLKGLITEVMVCPEIPAPYTLTCTHWLTDFRELSSHAWENLPESELLRLVQDVTHTSASCIYELLNTVKEFSWINGSQVSENETVVSPTTIFKNAPVEGWLSYGVPQLLALLQPDQGGQATGSDAALIHQYCTILATLLQHCPRALHHCTINYAEEIRYYVHESVVTYRLGEGSPIMPHTLKVVRSITKLISPKTPVGSR